MFRFECAKCGKSIKAEESAIGKIAKCPKCDCVFVVPLPPLLAPPADAKVIQWSSVPEENRGEPCAASGYFVRDRGRVTGPFDAEQLLRMRESGQIQGFHDLSTDKRTWLAFDSVFPTLPRPIRAAPVEPPDDVVEVDCQPRKRRASDSDEYDRGEQPSVRRSRHKVPGLSANVALLVYVLTGVGLLLLFMPCLWLFSPPFCLASGIICLFLINRHGGTVALWICLAVSGLAFFAGFAHAEELNKLLLELGRKQW